MKKNEENACNALIDILREIKGVEYKLGQFPEQENRNTPDVEVILTPKDECASFPKIAVEHTIIMAHGEQIAYAHQLSGIEKEIDQKCHESLPIGGCFALIAPPALIVGMNRKKRDEFVKEMAGWIPSAAKSLIVDGRSTRSYNGHQVSLWCVASGSRANGMLGMIAARPENAEQERQKRFRRAIEEKLPKLVKYKKKGFGTALLLEDVSVMYANPDKDLIPSHLRSAFQSQVDYVVIFISQGDKMIVCLVWKEESRLYSGIPENRRFFDFTCQS